MLIFFQPASQLYMYMCMCQSFSHIQLFAVPRTVNCQAPLSIEISRQEYWSGLPFPSPGDLPNPGIEPGSPTLQADTIPSEPPGKPRTLPVIIIQLLSHVQLFVTPWTVAHQASPSMGLSRPE